MNKGNNKQNLLGDFNSNSNNNNNRRNNNNDNRSLPSSQQPQYLQGGSRRK